MWHCSCRELKVQISTKMHYIGKHFTIRHWTLWKTSLLLKPQAQADWSISLSVFIWSLDAFPLEERYSSHVLCLLCSSLRGVVTALNQKLHIHESKQLQVELVTEPHWQTFSSKLLTDSRVILTGCVFPDVPAGVRIQTNNLPRTNIPPWASKPANPKWSCDTSCLRPGEPPAQPAGSKFTPEGPETLRSFQVSGQWGFLPQGRFLAAAAAKACRNQRLYDSDLLFYLLYWSLMSKFLLCI